MRYTIMSTGLPLAQIEKEIARVGGKDIVKAHIVGHLFCELTEEAAEKLSAVPGLKVTPVRTIRSEQVITEETEVLPAALPSPQQELTVLDVFSIMRDYFTPAITGTGLTVAVLDTGVRKTHKSLVGKVVYEYNTTESPTVDDIFGHGTGVAFLIAGGIHGSTEKTGVSPGASIMNIKVLSDEGVGTDETIIMGINKVCELAEAARKSGLLPTHDMYPNIINISIGAEDTGDADDPLRVACRKAVANYAIDVICAAGNSGPKRSTVMLPATEPKVVAVGGLVTGSVEVWEKSARGPTLLGDTKPDFVFWATDIEVASHKDDESYDAKSGTSFSTPFVTGLAGLLWETGRRAYGELWPFRWSQVLEFAPYYCVKPVEAAVMKDNTYGYGMPAMGVMVNQITQPVQEADITQAMPMFIGMAMMVSLVGGMV